ncbi:sensor domain-containing diguanylate cyclase [Deinococcus hohokamensis]|uniref:Diguanylate cyclase domain-containing protein n=1 Tax=Deinococcus hohokamensis TaxID=309883 RepID=A0ABV9ICY4_9DEIO
MQWKTRLRLRRPPQGEAGVRLAYVLLAGLALVIQLGMAAVAWRKGAQGDVHEALLAAGICAVMGALVLHGRVPVKVVQGLVLGATFFWVSVPHLMQLGSTQPVEPTAAMGVVVLGLLAYTWLPVPSATLLVAVPYALLLWSAMTRGPADPDLLTLSGFTIILTAYLSVFGRQVQRERAHRQRWQTLAFRDPLTGLPNRRGTQMVLSSLAEAGEPYSVILLDIDHFKTVNDRLGHSRGDEVLRHVARCLDTATAGQGIVSRWGGEEFLVVLPQAPLPAARDAAQRLVRSVRHAHWPGLPRVTISAGTAAAPEVPAQDPPALLHLADQRLYEAKAGGRDQAR